MGSHLNQNWPLLQDYLAEEVLGQIYSLVRMEVGANVVAEQLRRNCSSLIDHVQHRRRIYASQRRADGDGFLGFGSREMHGELARQRNQYFFPIHRCRCFTDDGAECKWDPADVIDFGRFAPYLSVDMNLHILPLLSVLFEEHFDDVAPSERV